MPESERNTLIAAFNSGFKMDSANGGVYFAGEEVRPLVQGAASLVIKTDGSATVGVWGRDFTMTPDISSVRQNLALMIDNGQLDPALDENDTSKWGATLGNRALVWRSGVGIDANGALIYAGGNSLSVLSLARTLQAAGAVRAMELDINTDWVSAYTYVNDPATDPNAPVIGLKLGGDMARGGDRYLQLGERDFFAFFAAPQAPTSRRPVDHDDDAPDHDHQIIQLGSLRAADTRLGGALRSSLSELASSCASFGRYPGSRRSRESVRCWRASKSRLQEFMQ